MTMTEHVTPLVRQLAERHGVALASVKGTGTGGRVTRDDVLRVAAAQAAEQDPYTVLFGDDGSSRFDDTPAPPAPTPTRVAAAVPTSGRLDYPSRFASGDRLVQIDPYAPNPLLDDLRQSNGQTVQAATRGGPPPTLFSGGDVPPYTASGNDPRALMKLPWMVRHAAAKANAAGWARIFDEYANDPDAAAMSAEAQDYGNSEYLQRMNDWGSNSGVNRAGDVGV
jgi:hypothetical protein